MVQAVPNVAEYTVSEISAAVKRIVEDNFGYVRVRGEISGFRGPHSSGHCYFALKDERARIEACIWKTTLQRLRVRPQEGLEVIATGRLTTFPGSSKYQIVIEALEPAGIGALMALLEERRRKLAAEGLFDETRKKPLPYLPRVIGVVTSPTGAVIRDILHRLAERFPTRVVIWPVRVQGETAPAEVAAAIRGFNALPAGGAIPRPDLLIVARGGGSLEDLWSFNEEIVARAAAESAIPLISAIGHETDFTLLDFVADRRAPTPTAAAEIAVPVRSELRAALVDIGARHFGATLRIIEGSRRDLRAAARALPRPEDLVAIPRRAFDELASRIGRALIANARAHRVQFERSAARLSLTGLARAFERAGERLKNLADRHERALAVELRQKSDALLRSARRLRIEPLRERAASLRRRLDDAGERATRGYHQGILRRGEKLKGVTQLLRSLSYRNILARGFAIVRDAGVPVKAAAGILPGSSLDVEFHDGHVLVTAARGERKRTASAGQGSLFDP
jgi:exodeoxyribonuclease VII large subunit